MFRPVGIAAVLATISKHETSGIVALVIGVVLLALGFVRAAIRTVLLLAGIVVAIVGVLLLTRAI